MLGSLPSSYLKWVSKNLRAGDTEYWAKLADEVLEDDVYKDRIEWEFAEKVLHGSDESIKEKQNRGDVSSVSMLLEISERFGWDNEDKIGWSKVNFELLGTSRGGRIPRSDQKGVLGRLEEVEKQIEPKIHSPFPGRESLLKKVMNKRRSQ
ncbi:hypothetical protein Rs2_03279 [Raphanus sativus]|nr:hypothetical protein Rs2_03279 [Raphanus sativus]